MRLIADWIMPYQGFLDIRCGRKAKCRVRIYEHEADKLSGSPVVLITDLSDNQREDIASAAEILVGTLLADDLSEMIDLSTCTIPLFINHYPKEITHTTDVYELVEFNEPAVGELVIEESEAGSEAEATGHRVVWSIDEARFVPADKRLVEMMLAGAT